MVVGVTYHTAHPLPIHPTGLLTVGIVGYDGGRIVAERLADHTIVVRSDYIPRIQEVQASIYHVLREVIEWCMA